MSMSSKWKEAREAAWREVDGFASGGGGWIPPAEREKIDSSILFLAFTLLIWFWKVAVVLVKAVYRVISRAIKWLFGKGLIVLMLISLSLYACRVISFAIACDLEVSVFGPEFVILAVLIISLTGSYMSDGRHGVRPSMMSIILFSLAFACLAVPSYEVSYLVADSQGQRLGIVSNRSFSFEDLKLERRYFIRLYAGEKISLCLPVSSSLDTIEMPVRVGKSRRVEIKYRFASQEKFLAANGKYLPAHPRRSDLDKYSSGMEKFAKYQVVSQSVWYGSQLNEIGRAVVPVTAEAGSIPSLLESWGQKDQAQGVRQSAEIAAKDGYAASLFQTLDLALAEKIRLAMAGEYPEMEFNVTVESDGDK